MDPSVLTIAKIPALPVGAIIAYVVFMFAFMILSRRSKFENLYSESNADQIRF